MLIHNLLCRHWRYISCFHGPWLQLPPEVLETLANSNYTAPRPHPIDPSVFFDLVKIRKAVDEATNLAVRAASGVTSAALSSSLNTNHGMINSPGVAALGLGFGGNGGGAKLSRERKQRMRELATQKLSQAYHLDEIAASVATMQSASTLEDLPSMVLQRAPTDYDARYVHFFHEKIPSRMMAEFTPLDTLNELLGEKPTDASPWRTRALTQIFKEDWMGAAKDLTEGLAIAKWMSSQHKAGKDQLVLAKTAREEIQKLGRDWRQEVKIEEDDQPSSLEKQLLFHRANVHFAMAWHHVHPALDAMHEVMKFKEQTNSAANGIDTDVESRTPSPVEQEAHRRHLEHRKMVKTNAKRALRDYNAFLAHFDYTPGMPREVADDFMRRVNAANGQSKAPTPYISRKQIPNGSPTEDKTANDSSSHALVLSKKMRSLQDSHGDPWPSLPPIKIFQVSQLFSATPPPTIPRYPPDNFMAVSRHSEKISSPTSPSLTETNEAVTYHPLMTDALHSMLLCHCLLQTPPTELRRHAHNAARITRICDGYPIFLAARSPARADWTEILRRTGNWIDLRHSWESLCRPALLPGHEGADSNGNARFGSRGDVARNGTGNKKMSKEEMEKQKAERRKQEAIMEALADERVVDEESFQRAVRAREKRAIEDEEAEERALKEAEEEASGKSSERKSSSPPPKRWVQDDGKDYPISTDRAEAISRWVREAPLTVEGAKGKRGGKKSKPKKATSFADSVENLSINEPTGRVEEEIDE